MSEPVSKVVRRTKHFIENPSRMLTKLMVRHCPELVPDKQYIQYLWEQKMDYPLDLKNPRTFNEKLQWLKLYDRKPEYTTMVDKYRVKQWVADRIGEEYVIPTLAVYQSVDEIDLEKLPDQFVMKCNHDSGSVVICRDKDSFDLDAVKRRLGKAMKRNYYWNCREWPYKKVLPKIIAEEYLEEKNSYSISDYKFFCFNGLPKMMYVSKGLENHETAAMSFYDMNFDLLDCKRKDFKPCDGMVCKPMNFEKMKDFAGILSCNVPHLRVDFYEVDGKLFFGENTFSTNGGWIPFEEKRWDVLMGEWLELPKHHSR